MKTLSYLVALVMMFAGIYYGKLLYDRDLAIAKAKDPSPDDGGAKPTPEPTAKPVPTPVATPTPEPEAKLTADDEKRLEYPLKDLASGQFQSAVDGAHQISLDSAASVGLRAAGRRLEEKAKLFQVLMQASRPHKFVGAQDLVAVTLAATGARYVARVVEETDKNVKLSLDDGRELEVRPDQIKKREKLPPNAWSEQQRAKL